MGNLCSPSKNIDLQHGDHLCLLFETEKEHRAIIKPFLQQGLKRREKVIYIADDRSVETVMNYLQEDGFGVEPFIRNKQLQFMGIDETYLRGGTFNSEHMSDLLQSETDKALSEGYAALRLTGEMTWGLFGLSDIQELFDYEAKVNNFIKKNKCIAVCQYDRRSFSHPTLLNALATHPKAVVGAEVHDNFYYIPPDEFITPHSQKIYQTSRLLNPNKRQRPEGYLQELRAIVVDDQEENRILIKHYLHEMGYACDTAQDALDALKKLGQKHYDLMIADIRMPGKDGLQLTREVRRNFPHIDCIIITGHAAEYSYSNIIDTGAADFIVKPFSMDELKAKIKRLIKEKDVLRQLQQSEEKFRLLYEQAPLGYQSLDKDCRFIDVNQTWQNILEYSREEIIGYEFTKVLHPDSISKVNNFGKMHNTELQLVKKDGSVITVLYNDKVSCDEYGDLLQTNGIFLDITELKLTKIIKEQAKQLTRVNHLLENQLHRIRCLNNELESQNKELEAFSYTVSHDLRTPLHVIDGFSRLLLKKYASKLDYKGQDYLNQVRIATQRMGELIEDLLSFSFASRTEMQHQSVDLSAIAKTIAIELQHTSSDRNVNFMIADDIIATGDRRLLQIVIENLLGNAWKFTGHESQAIIELNITQKGDKKIYFVRDNGVGFDTANAEKLFEVFERLHTKEEFPGTGIGLATVKRIITRHGGRIWAESAVGKGTTFYFTISS